MRSKLSTITARTPSSREPLAAQSREEPEPYSLPAITTRGVLPLTFMDGQNAQSLGLTGREIIDISGLGDGSAKEVTVTATAEDGKVTRFKARVRLDTPQEVDYYRHGGILPYVLRQLVA